LGIVSTNFSRPASPVSNISVSVISYYALLYFLYLLNHQTLYGEGVALIIIKWGTTKE
jgi:hypothetical protein